MVCGQGLPPTEFETEVITCALNKEFSGNINFKNPFKNTINIMIKLDTKDLASRKVFGLLLSKSINPVPS